MSQFEIIIDNLDFPEGPCFDSKDRLWCTGILSGNLVCLENGSIYRYQVGENINGATIDGSDHIWFTDSKRNLVGVFDPETKKTNIVCDNVNGKPLNRPNDLRFDRSGNLIVSCHADGRKEPTGYLIAIDRNNQARKILSQKYFTNGIAFARDGKSFVYAETYNQQLWQVQWDDKNLKVISESPFAKTDGPFGPDGITYDINGNLYVTVFDHSKIDVFNTTGEKINTINLPYKRPTSCAFDPSGKLGLVITEAEKGIVLSYKTESKGEIIFRRGYD